MKAKYLLLLSLFCYIGVKAGERKISLFNSCTETKAEWVKDCRSVSIVPTATIDGSILRIYSDVVIENVSIVIKDKSDNVIYFNTNMIPSRCHIFELYGLSEGEYTLDIESGDSSYYGCFSIK